jgi:hypothetical protein
MTSLAGRVLSASVTTARSQPGVIVPRSAIVRWQGSQWVYVARGASFERVELVDGRSVEDGWFVPDGLKAADRVVVAGAGTLLAIERGDEAGDE